jgi:hypothetical protein
VTLTLAETIPVGAAGTTECQITASITIDLTASEASPGVGRAGGAEAGIQTAQALAIFEAIEDPHAAKVRR